MLGKVPGAGQHGPTHQPAPPAPKCWQGGCRQGRQLRTAASLSVQNGAGASPVCLRRGGQFVSGQQAVDGEWRPVDGRRVGDNGQSMGDGWETATRGSNDGRRMGDGGQSVSGLGRAGRAGAACPTLDHSGSNLHRGGPSGLGGWQSAPACPDRPCPAAPTRPWAGGRAGAPWTTSQAVWQLRFAESSKWGKSQPAHQSGPHPRPVRLQSGPALGGAQGPLLRPAHPGPFPRQERVTNRKNNG